MGPNHFATLDFIFELAAQEAHVETDVLRFGKGGSQDTNLWRKAAIYLAHDVVDVPIRAIAVYMSRSVSGVGQYALLMHHMLKDRSRSDPGHILHREPFDRLYEQMIPDPHEPFMPPDKPLKPGTITDDT